MNSAWSIVNNNCFAPAIILDWKVSIATESEMGVSGLPRLQG